MSFEVSADVNEQVRVLREAAGICLRPEVLTLRIAGPDRLRYLNGMLTNDVLALKSGDAQRSIKTTHKGKVQGVLRVRAEEESVLVDVLEVAAPVVAEALVKLLIMDDATLSDATADREIVNVQGPGAAEVLSKAGYDVQGLESLKHRVQQGLTAVRDDVYGVPSYELHVAAGQSEDLLGRLSDAGGIAVSSEALTVLRVEAGVPIDGADLNEGTIPLEARLEPAISFTKGCYLGQEVIARAHNLGGVKHILVGFEVRGEVVPEAGAEVFVQGVEKPTGTITSAVYSPTRGGVIALGYVRVVHQEANTELRLSWSGQESTAAVVTLPFVH